MNLNIDEYRSKVLGCWMGKNIGGTLGAPMEWRRQMNDVTFYTQELCGEPLPNDDLDIQLLWLVALEERGLELNAQTLAEYWCLYVTPHWSEYGTAKINMRSGLMPPLSGTFQNDFKDSCGAFIRSEIWACIAPGRPQIAARYAYEDAILDHGRGEGTFAEVFTAVMESAAFLENDLRKLIDIGLSYIPEDCGVAKAVHLAIACYDGGKTWQDARNEMLEKYRGQYFFKVLDMVSKEDQERGFVTGKQGWDVPSNIGMLVIGLLYGEGDFDKTICTAVNCGEDTDCTGATAGSIFGIMHGADAIGEKWMKPIGRKIKTACLNLGELGYFGNQLPQDVDSMTERTTRIAQQLTMRHGGVSITPEATDISGFKSDSLKAGNDVFGASHSGLYRSLNGPLYHFDFLDVAVDYGDELTVRKDESKPITLTIYNTYKTQVNLNLKWYLPEGWSITPADRGCILSLPPQLGDCPTVKFEITPNVTPAPLNRAVLEITSEGRPLVMLVPIVLRSGSLQPAE